MGHVPAPVAAALLSTRPALHGLVVAAAVLVGARPEIDCTHPALPAVVADTLVSYDRACRRFWVARAASRSTGPVLRTRRLLVDERENAGSKGGRRDLRHLLDAADGVAGLSTLVEDLTGPDPDWAAVTAAGHQLERDGQVATVTAALVAPEWPLSLGGPPLPGERHREVQLTVNHAPSRDRRVRRLVRVVVATIEEWPDPTEWLEDLPPRP